MYLKYQQNSTIPLIGHHTIHKPFSWTAKAKRLQVMSSCPQADLYSNQPSTGLLSCALLHHTSPHACCLLSEGARQQAPPSLASHLDAWAALRSCASGAGAPLAGSAGQALHHLIGGDGHRRQLGPLQPAQQAGPTSGSAAISDWSMI